MIFSKEVADGWMLAFQFVKSFDKPRVSSMPCFDYVHGELVEPGRNQLVQSLFKTAS